MEFNMLPLSALVQRSRTASTQAARASLDITSVSLEDFAHLISPASADLLEPLARRSQRMTQQGSGKVMRLMCGGRVAATARGMETEFIFRRNGAGGKS